jgi:hypothetical protein
MACFTPTRYWESGFLIQMTGKLSGNMFTTVRVADIKLSILLFEKFVTGTFFSRLASEFRLSKA